MSKGSEKQQLESGVRRVRIEARPSVYASKPHAMQSPKPRRRGVGWSEDVVPLPHFTQNEGDKEDSADEAEEYRKYRDATEEYARNTYESEESAQYPYKPECSDQATSLLNVILETPYTLILFIGCGIILYSLVFSTSPSSPDVKSNPEQLKKKIEILKDKFPSQDDDMWHSITSGIKTIVTEDPTEPSVFLLLYEGENQTSACLAKEVGKEAVEFLSSSEKQPIIVQGEELKEKRNLQEDYGLFLQEHKKELEDRHVMVVNNLQEIPAKVAQTFHSLCDTHTPLVRKAAYLFTLQVGEKKLENSASLAEKTLRNLWRKSLDNDTMEPLITRITNTVFAVNSEAKLPCSSL